MIIYSTLKRFFLPFLTRILNFIDKFLLRKNNQIKIHGPVENIKNILKNSICAVNNVNIATGFQTKTLKYMSYGLPTLALKKVRNNEFKDNKDIIYFKNNYELIEKISKIKNNKELSEAISKICYSKINKDYTWDKRLFKYLILKMAPPRIEAFGILWCKRYYHKCTF
jgi:spore maturation protein CgeB